MWGLKLGNLALKLGLLTLMILLLPTTDARLFLPDTDLLLAKEHTVGPYLLLAREHTVGPP